MLPTFASLMGHKSSLVDTCKSSRVLVVFPIVAFMSLLSTDIVKSQKSLLHIMTHCDKKPRGKVGGSAISVYQALLHSPTESLGTRLGMFKCS